jgi:hypothetical protein
LHLIDAIKSLYECTTEWDGTLYCGITLKWDYLARTVDLSMPGYMDTALHKFQHPLPSWPEHPPHAWHKPVYGQTTQQPFPEDGSNHLTSTNILRIQQIVGTLLYYAGAVDVTLLVALNSLATEQSKGTENTAKVIIQVLNYCAIHPDATLCYHGSGMVLHIDSDASDMSMPKARSRVDGHHYLSSNSRDPTKAPTTNPPPNGPIHTVCHKLRNVMASAAEAEVGGLFVDDQDAVPIRTTLEELNHPQPPTPIKTDNSTASGIANNTLKQRKSRAVDMRFYWIRDRVKQNQFIIYWRPGTENLGDYFTKHHPTSHHRLIRDSFLVPKPTSRKYAPSHNPSVM